MRPDVVVFDHAPTGLLADGGRAGAVGFEEPHTPALPPEKIIHRGDTEATEAKPVRHAA